MPTTTETQAPPAPTPAVEEEQELTTAEQIAAAVEKDQTVRIVVSGEEASSVEDASTRIMGIVESALKVAKTVSSAAKTHYNRTRELAVYVVELRQSIVLDDGIPDWGGKTETYKAAIEPIIRAAMGPEEAYLTVRNRLQKAAVRMLSEKVAAVVVEAEGIEIEPQDVKRLISSGPRPEEVQQENVAALISEVNSQFRVGVEDRGANMPLSPFEEKPTRNRTGLSNDEAAGSGAAQSLPSFRAAMRNLAADVWTAELVLILQDAHKVLTSSKPSFGDGGRKVASDNLLHVARIAAATGRITAEQGLNKEQRDQLAVSLSFDPKQK